MQFIYKIGMLFVSTRRFYLAPSLGCVKDLFEMEYHPLNEMLVLVRIVETENAYAREAAEGLPGTIFGKRVVWLQFLTKTGIWWTTSQALQNSAIQL